MRFLVCFDGKIVGIPVAFRGGHGSPQVYETDQPAQIRALLGHRSVMVDETQEKTFQAAEEASAESASPADQAPVQEEEVGNKAMLEAMTWGDLRKLAGRLSIPITNKADIIERILAIAEEE